MTTVTLDGVDPFSYEFEQDPLPYYEAMRESGGMAPAGLGPRLRHALRPRHDDPS